MIDILMKITVICALTVASVYSAIGAIKYVIIPLIYDVKNGTFKK